MKIITGARLIDGTGQRPLGDPVITVEDGVIRSVTSADETAVSRGDEIGVIDARGKTILPGLIDAHVHLAFSAGPDAMGDLMRRDDDLLLLEAVKNAQLALGAGVTTLRDCGDRGFVTLSLKKAIESGIVLGPRLVVSGAPITTTAGHLYYIGLEADTKDELRKAVRELAKAGSDFIKVCATGGGMTADTNVRAAQYTADELKVLVEDAHRLGRRVAAHAHGTEGIRNSAEAGVGSIEHCSWLGRDDGFDYDERAVDMIVDKGLYICHTIAGQRQVTEEEEQRTKLRGPEIPWAFHKRALEAGARMVIGSDAGIPGTRFEDFARSLEVAVKRIGFSNMQAIEAATRRAAELLGLEKDVGTVEIGKRADLIIVDGNPLEDITALQRIDEVIKDGEVVASRAEDDRVWLTF